MSIQEDMDSSGELALLNPIRVETAIARYPIHTLAKNKNGDINIDIHEKNDQGETTLQWKVTYNSGFKRPGPLAYKTDTLVINRRIEEAPRPIPPLIRLGSVRDICRELGVNEGQGTRHVKQALHQNASAYIQARIQYKSIDGTVETAEFGDTRYGVIFTGKKLPDGRTADAVYISLHNDYREILNKSITRPLDYDYLKSLPPAPQRFYELLSYQMYSALKYDRPRAKLAYSMLCTHAPQKRHSDWSKVRSQMNKVHRPHLKSGYIKKIESQPTTDSQGNPDWFFFYSPGPKAFAEFKTFNKRALTHAQEPEPLLMLAMPEQSPLEITLVGHGWQPDKAAWAVQNFEEEKISTQIAYLEFEMAKKPGKIKDPAAWLYAAITGPGHAKPKGFVSAAEREQKAAAKRQDEQKAAAARAAKQAEDARERDARQAVARYWESLSAGQQAALQAQADAGADPETLALENGPLKRFSQQVRRDAYIRNLLAAKAQADA